MQFTYEIDKQQCSHDNVWLQFIEDHMEEPNLQSPKKVHLQSTFLEKKLNPSHSIDQFFFNFQEQEKKKQIPQNLQQNNFSGIQVCKPLNVTQNRNALKFKVRVFFQYHINYRESQQDQDRIQDVNEAFKRLCEGDQGKIKLVLLKYLLKQSKFNKRNRQIFSFIFHDWSILKKELFFNGNVKRKRQYLYACKVMRLRCRSSMLCDRAQSR